MAVLWRRKGCRVRQAGEGRREEACGGQGRASPEGRGRELSSCERACTGRDGRWACCLRLLLLGAGEEGRRPGGRQVRDGGRPVAELGGLKRASTRPEFRRGAGVTGVTSVTRRAGASHNRLARPRLADQNWMGRRSAHDPQLDPHPRPPWTTSPTTSVSPLFRSSPGRRRSRLTLARVSLRPSQRSTRPTTRSSSSILDRRCALPFPPLPAKRRLPSSPRVTAGSGGESGSSAGFRTSSPARLPELPYHS